MACGYATCRLMRSLTLGMRMTIVAGDTSLMRAMREAICSRKISVGEEVILPARMWGWDTSTKGPSWSQRYRCDRTHQDHNVRSLVTRHVYQRVEGLVVEVVLERVWASGDMY